MDGTNRKVLIGTKIAWPNGLAIDHLEQRIYWNDCKLNTIESSDLDGKNRNIIISSVPHPYGLVVVKNHIYWTDWQTRALHRADKFTGSDRLILKDDLEGLMDVRAVEMETKSENVCGNNNGGRPIGQKEEYTKSLKKVEDDLKKINIKHWEEKTVGRNRWRGVQNILINRW
nr:unnamed protein product [Callosobruchus analis]